MMLIAASSPCLLSSCSSIEDADALQSKGQSEQNILNIAEFPAYNDSNTTRTIGTSDAGKTAWTNGDTIYAKMDVYRGYDSSSSSVTGEITSTNYYIFVYDGAAWSTRIWSAAISAYTADNCLLPYNKDNGVKIEAWYAPNYTMDTSAGKLTIKNGKYPGTAEYLTYTKDMAATDVSAATIAFIRNYARMRIHVPKGLSVKTIPVSGTFTTPEGVSGAGSYTVSDDNENAFFYGNWNRCNFFIYATVDNEDYILPRYYMNSGLSKYLGISMPGKSYAYEAIPIKYFSTGDGTADRPFLIFSKMQMVDLLDGDDREDACENNHYYYKLACDIDMDGYCFQKSDFRFEGIFDGNFHTVSNYLHKVDDDYFGLFPQVKGNFCAQDYNHKNSIVYQPGSYGIIKNLTVRLSYYFGESNAKPTTGDNIGVLIGNINSGAVINCRAMNTDLLINNDNLIAEQYIGGLIGVSKYSYIYGCHAENYMLKTTGNTLLSRLYVGGLVGYAEVSSFVGCYVDGQGPIVGNNIYAGGFVGLAEDIADDVSGGYFLNIFLTCYADGRINVYNGRAGSFVCFGHPQIAYLCASSVISTKNTILPFCSDSTTFNNVYENRSLPSSLYSDVTKLICTSDAQNYQISNKDINGFITQYADEIGVTDLTKIWRYDTNGKLRLWWEIDKCK